MNLRLKTGILVAAGALLSLSPAIAQRSTTHTPEELARQKALYSQVDGDILRGRFTEAEKKARALIAARPGDPYMRKLLSKVQKARIDFNRHSAWERKMRSIIVPDVNLDAATLEEVAEYVRRQAVALTGSDAGPNIVLQSDAMRDREVTLRLKNVPLGEVLKYAGQMTGVRFAYQKHAIVATDLRPAGSDVVKKAEPAPAPEPAIERQAAEFPVISFQAPAIRRQVEGL